MSRDDTPIRKVGESPSAQITKLVLVGIAVLLGLFAVLHLGALLSAGMWAPGGINPAGVVIAFVTGGAHWTWGHTIATVLVLLPIFGGLGLWVWLTRDKRSRRARGDKVAKHLGSAEAFTETAVRKHAGEALGSSADLVGIAVARVVKTNADFWVGFRDGMVAIMGPGSGKTTGEVITGALDAPGACWVTSNKPDVVAALYSSREQGHTWVFDPQQISNMDPEFYYDLLSDVRDGLRERIGTDGQPIVLDQRLTRAVELAQQFANSSREPGARADAFFDPQGRTLLASLLLAAAVANLPITRVLEWTYQPENRTPRDILLRNGLDTSARQIEGVQDLHAETRGSVYTTASGFISFVQDVAGRAWLQRMGPDDHRPEFNPATFVRSEDLMICLSREGVGSFGPALAAMTNATIRAAEDYAAASGGRLPVPIVFQLDEVANVCRIPALPDLVSHVGSRGIFLAIYLQSPAQARAAWGDDGWDKLFGSSVVRIVGRGLIDIQFLKNMSDAAGEQPVLRYTSSRSSNGRMGGGSTTSGEQWTMEPILPVSKLVAMPQWRAVAFAAGEAPIWLELVPYFRRPELAARVDRSKRAFAAMRPELTQLIEDAELADQGVPTAADAVVA